MIHLKARRDSIRSVTCLRVIVGGRGDTAQWEPGNNQHVYLMHVCGHPVQADALQGFTIGREHMLADSDIEISVVATVWPS